MAVNELKLIIVLLRNELRMIWLVSMHRLPRGCFLVKPHYSLPTVEQFVCQSCHNSVGCSSSEIHCNIYEHILSSSGIRGNVLLASNWFPSGRLAFLPEFLSPLQKMHTHVNRLHMKVEKNGSPLSANRDGSHLPHLIVCGGLCSECIIDLYILSN